MSQLRPIRQCLPQQCLSQPARPLITTVSPHDHSTARAPARALTRGWLLSLVLGLVLSAPSLASEVVDPLNPSAVYGESVGYTVFRNNNRIGTHKVSFKSDGPILQVDVASSLTVTILKIPVFRFNYSATERWQAGVLQSVQAIITEKGKSREVSAQRDGELMTLTQPDGKTDSVPLDFASNHWHPGVLDTNTIFNTLTGKANAVTLERIGTEAIDIGGESVEAEHYRYTGQLQTEVWYDAKKRWVKLRFEGEDGSVIEYRCDGLPA